MSDLNLAIKIAVDASQAQQEIVKARKLLEELFKTTSNVEAKKNIQASIIQFKALEEELKTVSSSAKKMGEEMGKNTKAIDLQAQIANLKSFNEEFQKLTGSIIALGKSTITEANSVNKLEFRIKSLSSSSKEAKESIDFINKIALSKLQPFDTKALLESGAILTKFKVNVEAVLPKIIDLASAHKKDLAPSAEIVSKALSGVRGGIMGLQSEFGITKERLQAYGAEMTKSGEIEKDSVKTKQAIISVLDEMKGKADEAGKGYGASFVQLNNQISALKVQIGRELLPVINQWVRNIGSVVSQFTKLNEGTKSFLASNVLVIGGLGLVASSFMNAVTSVNAFRLALVGLGQTVSIGTLAFAGVAVAVGVVANTAIDGWRKMETLKAERIVSETKKMADGYKSVKDIMEDIKKTPLQIELDGNTDAKLKAIEEKLKAIRELEAYNAGKDKTFTFSLSPDMDSLESSQGPINPNSMDMGSGAGYSDPNKAKQQTMTQPEALEFLTARYDELTKAKEKATETKDVEKYNKQIEETKLILNQLYSELDKDNSQFKKQIENLGILHDKIENLDKDLGVKIVNKWSEAIKNISKESSKLSIPLPEEELKAFFTEQKKLLDSGVIKFEEYAKNVNNFLSKYTLTTEQWKNVTIAWGQAQKVWYKEWNDYWGDFITKQKTALNNGEINQAQYNKNILNFLTVNKDNLSHNTDLKQKIELEYSQAVKKLNQDILEDKKKKLKEELELHKKQKEALEKIESSTASATTGKLDDIDIEFKQKKARLEEEKTEYEKLGIDKEKIDNNYYLQLDNLERERLQKVKDYVQEEMNQHLGLHESLLQLKQAEETSPINELVIEDFEKKKSYLQQEYDMKLEAIGLIKTEAESYIAILENGGKLNNEQEKTLNLYINQKTTLDSVGDKIAEIANKEIASYNQRKEALMAYLQAQLQNGGVSVQEADRMMTDFFETSYQKSNAKIASILSRLEKEGWTTMTKMEEQFLTLNGTITQDFIKSGSTLSNNLKTSFDYIGQSFKTNNGYIKDMKESVASVTNKTGELSSNMGTFSSSTDKASDSVNNLNTQLGNTNQKLTEAVGKMQEIGNLSAKTTGNETGNFMSVDEAFTGLPGTGDYNASTEKSNSWFSKYMDRTAGTENTGSTGNYDDMWRKMVAIQQAYEAGDKGNSSVGIKKGDFSVYNSYLKKYTELYGHDNPSNDKKAEELGMKLSLKAIDKNFLDISKYIMQGSVKGINMTLAKLPNTTNINNSKQQSSSSQQTVNKYYFEGSEISGNSSLKRDLNRVALNINSRYGQRSGRL